MWWLMVLSTFFFCGERMSCKLFLVVIQVHTLVCFGSGSAGGCSIEINVRRGDRAGRGTLVTVAQASNTSVESAGNNPGKVRRFQRERLVPKLPAPNAKKM